MLITQCGSNSIYLTLRVIVWLKASILYSICNWLTSISRKSRSSVISLVNPAVKTY